jgi:hypothetical protein
MCPLDNWIKTLPKQDQPHVAKMLSELWDVFEDLERKRHLRENLRNAKRKDFVEIIRTSNGLFGAFNMLFAIPDVKGEFVHGRNRKFIEHNREYGFNEEKYVHLLLSESISVFLRNVELFRSCLLFVLKTAKRQKNKKVEEESRFYHKMGIGELLNQIVNICGNKGIKIKDRIDVKLRNGLTHGLVWIDGLTMHYSEDVTFVKVGEIKLDDLWKKASDQSKLTQCLINLIPAWYSED